MVPQGTADGDSHSPGAGTSHLVSILRFELSDSRGKRGQQTTGIPMAVGELLKSDSPGVGSSRELEYISGISIARRKRVGSFAVLCLNYMDFLSLHPPK